jgi:hypothetical protein
MHPQHYRIGKAIITMSLPVFFSPTNSSNSGKGHHQNHAEWLRLDNAARIYVAMMGTRSPTAFRITAVTTEKVDPVKLQLALDEIVSGFPYFTMGLKFGFFWNYLQRIDFSPKVEMEQYIPCREFSPNSHLFRVIYYGKRISTEFSHVLTDGMGGTIFTRNLIIRYFHLKGYAFKDPDNLHDRYRPPSDEDIIDSYEQFYSGKAPSFSTPSRAFHARGKLIPRNTLTIISGTCTTGAILSECRKRGVSVNDYLSAHYLWALYQARGNSRRDIRLMVPVNLRKMYPSKTLRNFFLTISAQIRPSLGHYTFDEIVKVVNLAVQTGIDNKLMNQQIARNVAAVRNPLVRVIPLFVKLIIERWLFIRSGNIPISGVFSNLGQFQLPQELAPCVDRFVFVTSPNHITKQSVGAVGFNDKIVITFTNLIESSQIPMYFFTSLRKQGILVTIESNRDT